MNRILLPKFQNGHSTEDIYGTIGGYYPVGEYDNYYPQNTQQPSHLEQISDYLFGQQYGKYDNILNTLNYITRFLDYLNGGDVIQKGPYKGGSKLKKPINNSSAKKYKIKSKRDYYNEYFGGGLNDKK